MSTDLTLPLAAELLIPHRLPIRLIDRLVQIENLSGLVESVVRDGSLFLREDGRLDRSAMVELIAQSFAAVKGYGDLIQGKPVGMGFLVAVKGMHFSGDARKGDILQIAIEPEGETGDFVLGAGKIKHGEEVIATGSIMVWIRPK